MIRAAGYAIFSAISLSLFSGTAKAADLNQIFQAVQSEISGERARDYTMRMWLHDKWSTLPEWKKAVQEAQTIMKERGFDQTEIIEVPADGKTMTAAWTDPIGWDAKDATLEVIEPRVPDEFRYLAITVTIPLLLTAGAPRRRRGESRPSWCSWAASSYWWCDGKRNLNEVKKLCELEAGRPMENFDLINYYKFLKDYRYVEFVR